MKEKSTILGAIQSVAKTGSIGTSTVRAANIDVLVIENNSKTMRWLIDAETGVLLQTGDNSTAIQQVLTNLTTSQHINTQLEVTAINTQSKWREVLYVYLPLSVAGVEVYEGQFCATKLDFVDSIINSEKSAYELIGLDASDISNPMPSRLWNITGSVRNPNGGEFNRMVEDEYCVTEFSTSTGRYRMTKRPICKKFEAPLVGLSKDDIPISEVLDGLRAAPQVDAYQLFTKQAMCQQYKR